MTQISQRATKGKNERKSISLASSLILLGIITTIIAIGVVMYRAATGDLIDLAVFQAAGQAFVDGTPLYSNDFQRPHGLRFIYAPFAAMLFAPMALVDLPLLRLAWTIVNVILVWAILWMLLRHAWPALRSTAARTAIVATALLGVALFLEPTVSTRYFGQINLVLITMVVADLTGTIPRRFRGIATGIAAAIKVTPAAFGLVFLLRKDLGSVARAIATGLATIAIGFLVRPESSMWYWTYEFFRTDRAGGHSYGPNQALTGVLARIGLEGTAKDALWVAGALLIVATATWCAWRFTRRGDHIVALGLVALASLAAAPFAVTHHWVYALVLLPIAVAPAYRSWRPLICTAIVVFIVAPHRYAIDEPSGIAANAYNFVVGNGQFWMAMALLIGAVIVARRPAWARADETGTGAAGASSEQQRVAGPPATLVEVRP
ncbi:glycosyltransferase family 87 protein [Lolliginicoccus levis]|uniref:glycosyltransferase family 87 protein n=1 Tax=Lolliginicoccus levis TaxID=2919542 RepID=UPI00242013D6|nr:glycosyltransferase family 87 protein [Lolliginicoccus levis]